MALVNAENTSAAAIVTQVQMGLIQIRDAMATAAALHDFAAAVSLADLTAAQPDGPGMTSATAQALLNACADAWGQAQLYNTGTDTRNPPAGYVYGASQKLLIGSRLR